MNKYHKKLSFQSRFNRVFIVAFFTLTWGTLNWSMLVHTFLHTHTHSTPKHTKSNNRSKNTLKYQNYMSCAATQRKLKCRVATWHMQVSSEKRFLNMKQWLHTAVNTACGYPTLISNTREPHPWISASLRSVVILISFLFFTKYFTVNINTLQCDMFTLHQ